MRRIFFSIFPFFVFFLLQLTSADVVKGQNLYTSYDGLFTYTVPEGFFLSNLSEEYQSAVGNNYKIAYSNSTTRVNPSILINVTIDKSSALLNTSFIHYQRHLLQQVYDNVTIESVSNFASKNHPDILQVKMLSEDNKVRFYNSIYYFFYKLNNRETLMWTMTCTYSYQEEIKYSPICIEAASSFKYNNE